MNASLESRLARIKFSLSPVGADRIHYVNEGDVRVVLGRLPLELWDRLRAVHFNDHSRGARVPGYVTQGHREIALCALPPRMTLRAFLMKGQTPEQFGAEHGHKWPALAIRRFMLYDTFLHELGHLQLVNENGHSARLKFAVKNWPRTSQINGARACGRRPSSTPIQCTTRRPSKRQKGRLIQCFFTTTSITVPIVEPEGERGIKNGLGIVLTSIIQKRKIARQTGTVFE